MYRVLQELVNNAIKHADARKLSIEVIRHPTSLVLVYEDDGKGFDVKQQGPGVGLSNIFNRVEIFHGDVKLNSCPGQGCELEVSFDLETEKIKEEPR